jgi:hypothetical protein
MIMKKRRRIRLIATFALLILFQIPIPVIGQDATVRRATAETGDGLLFRVWLDRQTVKYGRDVVVHFTVENRSTKTVYLVHDNTSRIVVERDSIVVPRPFVPVGGHEGYDYSFTKVAPGRAHKGQLIISRDEYKTVQPWRMDVGFGYITDITGLDRHLGRGEDPAPLKALLSSRIETLLVCGLRVEVIDT